MTYRIIVKPSGFFFDVQAHETILEAALRCGYFFPHHCRMGVCGTCRGKVLRGEIDYDGKEILGLTADEYEKNDALFCCARPKTDLVIEVKDFGCSISATQWVYDVVCSQQMTKAITQIILRPSQSSHLFYQAGQYVKIIHADGRVSPLSIANAPQKDFLIELQLAHPENNLLAQDILRSVAEEKKLIFRGPYGNCTTGELFTDKPIIFLARGTGFASVKAMIEEMQKFKKYPRMHFYWSVTAPQEFYMDEWLRRWTRELKNFSYTPVLSRDSQQWPGKVGKLQEIVLQDYPDLTDYLVYISAPETIVHDVLHELQRAGLPRNRYYSDVFDYNPES